MKKMTQLWLLLVAFLLSVAGVQARIRPAYVYTEANKILNLIAYDDEQPIPTVWEGQPVTFFRYYSEDYTVHRGSDSQLSPSVSDSVKRVIVDEALKDYRWKSVTRLFGGLTKVKRIEGLEHIKVDETTRTMAFMFSGCQNLTSLDVSHFNTVNVTDMYALFAGCSSLTSLDVSNFNTANVKYMQWMFNRCRKLTSLDVSNFNTQNVVNMRNLFAGCESLFSIDVSNFNTEKVEEIHDMFGDCIRLKTLTFNNLDGRSLRDHAGVFLGRMHNLEYVDLSQAKNLSLEHLKSIAHSKPNAFALIYLPRGSSPLLEDPEMIADPDYFPNVITYDGTNFKCLVYTIADDTLTRYTGENLMPNSLNDDYYDLNFNFNNMRWEVNIPYGFTADRVNNTRKIGAKAGSAYTWFMPYSSPIPAGVEVYEFKEATVDGIVATFVRSTDTELKAQKPYLVKSTAGEVSTSVNATSEIPAYTPGNDVVAAETSDGWKFIGSFQWRTTEKAAEEGLHTLQTGNKWKHYEGSTARPRPFRAYLKKAGSGARELSVNFEDGSGITGIEKIELLDGNTPENNSIYDLNGRYLGTRRDVLPTGTYIIGGKTTRI